MAKTAILRSLYRSIGSRSYTVGAASHSIFHRHHDDAMRSFFNSSFHLPRGLPHGVGKMQFFRGDFSHLPVLEEFSGILVNLKMEIDDLVGLIGENVQLLSDELTNALRTVYHCYVSFLESFGPEESYLKKKVETELGTTMIHLKMRCGGLGSEWGKVAVLGTSGLSGSYIEQIATR